MRERFREGGKATGDGRAFFEEGPDRQQGHTRPLSLESQIKALLGQRAHAHRLHIGLPLSPTPQQEVGRNGVHLQPQRSLLVTQQHCLSLDFS